MEEIIPHTGDDVTFTNANEEYFYEYGGGQYDNFHQLDSSLASFRWSWTKGVVATGGHIVGPGGAILERDAPPNHTKLYVACDTAGVKLKTSYKTKRVA